MRKPFLVLLATSALAFAYATHHKHHYRVPIIDLSGAEEFVGTISEDQRTVSVSPRLAIIPETGPICHYELKSASGDELPFESEMLDKSLGTASIRLRDNAFVDCSHSEYHINVIAVRCADDSARSESVTLKVTVKDTNNHVPEFDAPWYSFEIDEGKVVSEIARLYATDKDCGHPYGKICRYEITNALEGNPFKIDDQGVLSNTRPLNYTDNSSHILTVVAHDCGMRHSKSTLVTVNVRQRCLDGLHVTKAEAEGVDYVSGSGTKPLLPNAELMLCPHEPACSVQSVESRISLNVERNGEHSLEAAKKCGMDSNALDLLPRPTFSDEKITVAPVLAKDDATDSDEDENDEEDEDKPSEKYLFDGKSNAVIVPQSTLKEVIPGRFTLAFSMKHARGTKREQSVKQNILCESDEMSMNRHHFAVYVRHCKMELLLRREAENAAAEFRAAEWRWEMPEVCDNQWHSYAILFSDVDNVTLLVDGQKFQNTDRNPEILDDWPLHQTTQVKTRVVVGACWHGRNQAMVQFFNGHLSSMYLVPGIVESQSTLQCLHEPKERLCFDAIDQLVPGESAITNNEQKEISLKANTLEDLSLLLQKTKYCNKDESAIGKREFSVTSKVICNGSREIPLGTYESTISLQKAALPVLSISGQNLIDTNRRSLKVGTLMLPNVQLTISQSKGGKQTDVTTKYNLDWCKVHLKPSRDMDLEYFSSPAALIASLNIDFEHDKQGILLKGEESVKGYQEILTKVHYFNTRPESYAKRMYTVQCSMMKGKVLSNELLVTANIKDDVEEELASISTKLDSLVSGAPTDETDFLKLEKHFEPSFDQLGANRLQNILEMDLPRPKALLSHHGYEVGQGAVAGGAVAVVVVICVGFLLVLLIVGVVKMREPTPRRRRNRKLQPEAGMEWDDAGMNITVNPLEDVEKREQTEVFSDGDDARSSDDDESYREDDELTDDEEEAEQVLPLTDNGRQGLEWDDSTLTHVSKTYRV